MWKEKLPEHCPPVSAKCMKAVAFRILASSIPNENDFIPYSRKFSDNPRYKNLCVAYAISFFDTEDNAKKAWENSKSHGNILGCYIGQFQLEENHGKSEYKINSGHISTWLYSSWNLSEIGFTIVSELKCS